VTHLTHLPARLLRWLLGSTLMAVFALGLAGRGDLPMVNAFLVACAAILLVAVLVIDPELARERLRRGQKGADPLRLLAIRLLFMTLFVVALLDVGRMHWSDTVPHGLQVAALAAFAGAMLWTFWAVSVNRFFVPVIRVQAERGHQVVDRGPYGIVRHPGYAGTIVMAPAGAVALGSWWALLPALAVSFLFMRRAAHEDRFLMDHLDGYARYAEHVRSRLVPGVW
jgi:protein-S-isoprenylcysteine O-methyltransferase Ste14